VSYLVFAAGLIVSSIAWLQVAHDVQRTVYQVKHDLLDDYMRQQLRSPSVIMTFA
jgi:hypothetical protein